MGVKLSYPTLQARSKLPFFCISSDWPSVFSVTWLTIRMIPKEEPSVVGKTSCYRKCTYSLYLYLPFKKKVILKWSKPAEFLVTTAMITARRPVTARQPVALVVHRFCGHFSSCSSLPWDDQDLRSLFCSFLTQKVALLSWETGQWNVWSSVILSNSPQNLVSSLHDRQYSWQAPVFFNIQE